MMRPPEPPIDSSYLRERLLEMLAIPSPTGFTDAISRYICRQLDTLNIPYELTRRGTIIATLRGHSSRSGRAMVNHIDTIGATVSGFNANGRLQLAPVGTWSSRFAEGGKVTLFTVRGTLRGQVLPLLASGHAFNEKVDELPVGWLQVELRLNEPVFNAREARALGIETGDFVAFDTDPEVSDNGYICARHLDNKAGAAALLTALKALRDDQRRPAVDLQALFTVTEEVGTGASASLADYITEFVGIDIGPVARGQNARETGVTLCAQDTSGPFDYHMMQNFKALCRHYGIPYQIDVFRYYYSDANSAIKAGHDVRDALITFGTDATHGYERTHFDSLESVARLLCAYSLSAPVHPLLSSDLDAFPHMPEQPVR